MGTVLEISKKKNGVGGLKRKLPFLNTQLVKKGGGF